jgi:dipeptidyl aminopeptidase/acylaminoacyl peptidase
MSSKGSFLVVSAILGVIGWRMAARAAAATRGDNDWRCAPLSSRAMLKRALLAILVLTSSLLVAQEPKKFELNVDSVMRGSGLVGYSPRAVRWSRDGEHVYFQWKQYTDPVEEDYDTYVVNRDGSGLRKLSKEEEKNAPPNGGNWTRDRRRAVFIDGGDVFLYDSALGKRRALTRTTETESNPRFTQDQQHVAFVRASNLFLVSLEDGSVEQKTNIVRPDDRGPHVSLFEDKEKRKTDSQKWIEKEAQKLSDVITRRAEERKEDEAERKAEIAIEPLKLEPRQTVTDLQITGDGKYVIAFFNTESDRAKTTIVPSYVTETGYTEDLPARTNVGDALSATKVGTISTSDGKVNWLKHDLKAKPEPAKAVEKKAETTAVTAGKTEKTAKEEQKTEAAKEPAERDIRMGNVVWSEDGTKAVLPVRSSDNKDWWLLALDPATAKTRVLFNEHDDAWVRWQFSSFVGFLPDNETLWLMSERTGWMHLYTLPFAGGQPKPLTSGKWEVDDVVISDDKSSLFYTSSEGSLYERHFYRMPIAGGPTAKLTTQPGVHNAVASPDGRTYADIYSYTNRPPEMFIAERRVTTSPAPDFAGYPWIDVPIVTFKARDGADVPAHVYKPANWNGGPAVIFVHGAGYLQNIHRGWSNYYREYMFHHLLMERGYLVIDIDYRASAGYGRDWRTGIYRWMGGKDLEDHVDAAKWLVREHKVDAKRIGIYGGSYGGFITLMGLFTTPDVFASGAALRPVTDWAHYNHGYTSNILNTPQSDPEAYRKSSPIYFAEGLKGHLLICHGVIDVNVHFQDSVRLAQRLIELRKENWELAMYPVEDHTFVEATSWADEYKRVLALFERTLK